MEEVERKLMSESEFEDSLAKARETFLSNFYEKGILYIRRFDAVGKYKSVRRAIKRGHVSMDGIIYPKRPFNNSKNSSINNRKKQIYAGLKRAN